MEAVRDGVRGLRLLLQINSDLLLMIAAIAAGLTLGAWLADLLLTLG